MSPTWAPSQCTLGNKKSPTTGAPSAAMAAIDVVFPIRGDAKHKGGYVRLPQGRVIWSIAFPKLVPRATIDHKNGKILRACMVAKLTHACFSGKIRDNRIWNLDDCSKAENVCHMHFNKHGFGPLKGKARLSVANMAKKQGVHAESFSCWRPCYGWKN